MIDLDPSGPRVCHIAGRLPTPLVHAALQLEPTRTATADRVVRYPECGLQQHAGTAHYALAMELDGPDSGAAWAVWKRPGARPALLVLPDCNAETEDGMDGCGLFAGHQGLHSWLLYDRELMLARSQLAGLRRAIRPATIHGLPIRTP